MYLFLLLEYMGRRESLSVENKKTIINMHNDGKNQREISILIGCHKCTVSRVIKQHKESDYLMGHKSGAGRPKITSQRDDRVIGRIVRKHRFTTLTDYISDAEHVGIKISRATMQRRLSDMGYKNRVPYKKPLVNAKQRKKRLDWCKTHMQHEVNYWENIIFSDESQFCIPIGEHGKVWRRKCEELSPLCTKKVVKHPGNVMVWGCMSSKGLGHLIFIDGKVNSAEYQRILTEGLLPTIEDTFMRQHCIFQHDLAPAHASKSSKIWLANQQLDVLPWPANSPDLNPIENVWRDIKFAIRSAAYLPRTKEELKNVIKATWEKFKVKDCRKLIHSMPGRCKTVIKMKGYPTKY